MLQNYTDGPGLENQKFAEGHGFGV